MGSIAGFLFWLIAARNCPPEAVGIAAACMSAVSLLSMFGEYGSGTAVIRFAPGMGEHKAAFVNTALLVTGIGTLVIAVVFAITAPLWSPELEHLIQQWPDLTLFLTTALFFTLGQFVDDIFIAFQSSQYMFGRNLIAAGLRLGLLLAGGRLFGVSGILFAFGASSLITVAFAVWAYVPRVISGYRLRFAAQWSLVRDKIGYALGNHLSGILNNLPLIIYPLIIMGLLGAEATAYYYTSSMVANVLFIVPEPRWELCPGPCCKPN